MNYGKILPLLTVTVIVGISTIYLFCITYLYIIFGEISQFIITGTFGGIGFIILAKYLQILFEIKKEEKFNDKEERSRAEEMFRQYI